MFVCLIIRWGKKKNKTVWILSVSLLAVMIFMSLFNVYSRYLFLVLDLSDSIELGKYLSISMIGLVNSYIAGGLTLAMTIVLLVQKIRSVQK